MPHKINQKKTFSDAVKNGPSFTCDDYEHCTLVKFSEKKAEVVSCSNKLSHYSVGDHVPISPGREIHF